MIYGGTGYKVLLVLHLLSVVIAFGPWFLNGVLPSAARRLGPGEGRAVNEANFRVSALSQYAMYAVFVFGFATIGASKKAVTVGETWVLLSVLAWVAIVGVLHGMVLPAQRALKDGGGDTAALTSRQAIGAGIINVLVVVAIVLMVFEPGH